ncbi:maleylacetoacetate isomerase, partial [bacterium]
MEAAIGACRSRARTRPRPRMRRPGLRVSTSTIPASTSRSLSSLASKVWSSRDAVGASGARRTNPATRPRARRILRAVPPLTLYTYWRSSSSYRVRVALAWKGVPYEAVHVNLLASEQKTDAYKAHAPSGYLPCLVVDGLAHTESVAIVELLDELFPEPALLPREPHARARVRTLVELVNAGIQPFGNLSVLHHLTDDKLAQRAWAQHFVARGLDVIERQMHANEALGVAGRYAYGDAITAADVYLVPQVYNARRIGLDMTHYPRVTEAAASVHARSVAATDSARRGAT